ncbi:DNA replication and repair protein RecN [Nonlabens sp. Hel1_33_55]|uniref:DNA repair protein RecN n=1 Tax=Nonlabens sp. Hel1_33_55 TaxID=1336802 RepID=UPI000875CA9E|nr:DNA repair protein RecN [Nonlabens sp. Hel1_33_55]SCY13418.1 DNA replication and repair protein RecN [Nonlabens sp. Hel1_33_55]
MLKEIHIQNYALIDQLDLEMSRGLTMITGETGAGKSIILGALGLVTGKRADLSAIRDTSTKCVVEVHFDISRLGLKDFFVKEDLDYQDITIIRREILPSGKSRSFVNDTPVTLNVVSTIGSQLIDIHSQHQTLQLATDQFQMETMNAFVNEQTKKSDRSGNVVLQNYQNQLKEYKALTKQLTSLRDNQAELSRELDYNTFLLNELEEAQIDGLNQEELEQENEQLSNVEQITEALSMLEHKISEEDNGILDELREVNTQLKSIKGFSPKYQELNERLTSVLVELEDMSTEAESLKDQVELDPERLEFINTKLAQLDNLYRKHQLDSVEDLIKLRDDLADKVLSSQNIDGKIKNMESQIASKTKELDQLAKELHDLRANHKTELEEQIAETVRSLGMKDAQFEVRLLPTETFNNNGKDQVEFAFTANRGTPLLALDKAASGGELSRLMLSIKALLSRCKQMPTIIFDEIDTGVSGSIAEKMAIIMKQMATAMQVITITHLPQIASAGDDHLIVRKRNQEDRTVSVIERLSESARVEEIAQMLSGGSISDAARENARILLQ